MPLWDDGPIMSTAPKGDSRIALYVGLAIQAAGIVWWASNLNSQVQHNDFQIQMIAKDVNENSEFVKLWPAGKWGSGSLPSDVRQDLKIGMLESDMDKVLSKLYNGVPKTH